MPGRATINPANLLLVYAQEDEAFCSRLKQHISLLQRQGYLSTWDQSTILPGDDWKQQTAQYLQQAHMILLLISADFLASDFCYDQLMQQALVRHRQGTARVIPVIVRACDWSSAPFAHLQALPTHGKPVAAWSDPDEACAEIARRLRRIIEITRRTSTFPEIPLNRARVQRRLKSWYRDFLDQSLQQAIWLDLSFVEIPDALAHPLSLVIREAHVPDRPLPAGISIAEVYEDANHELLILGEPGAGKSTQLYTLAQHLLAQTEQDPLAPLPFVLPLSTWAIKQQSLHTWMIEQLCILYKVPEHLARHWVQGQHIIPLLDGLDEMPADKRLACIQKINDYHQHTLTPLVVCSRHSEYTEVARQARFDLQRAVAVQPLSQNEIAALLRAGGRSLAGLRAAMRENPALQELARTPLLFNLLLLTYQGVTVRDLPTQEKALLKHLLSAYSERVIREKGHQSRYPQAVTTRWLHTLAAQMHVYNLSLWAIEDLQPTWLSSTFYRCYRWSYSLIAGLIFGLGFGLIYGLIYGRNAGLICGLGSGLICGLLARFINTINLAERLEWSWQKAKKGIGAGLGASLVCGGFFGVKVGQSNGPVIGILFGLSCIPCGLLIYGLSSGLQTKQSDDRSTLLPGEGLRHSLKNGIIIGLIIGLAFGLGLGLGDSPGVGLGAGLGVGLCVGLTFGLTDLIQHGLLRFWLWTSGSLPWRLRPFLEDAKARHLLKRVGGTYQFMHRLLQEYFADLEV